ncbi:MAG: TIGR00730 family Rossman fold protein [Candidatus Eisenbacteria sp.]|nr:TIGR00730 family Rossman fold protein [Candidatus Eisenbacteria bacterium]
MADSVDDILDEVRQILEAEEDTLDAVLLKEMLGTIIRIPRDPLPTLDLKLINRSLKEMRYAFSVFRDYRDYRKVTIFGSARTAADDPYYALTVDFARMLAEKGYMVITGAAEGIMRAGNEGAGRENSFGVNIMLPFEQEANPIIADDPKLMMFKYFFTRKLVFVKESSAITLLPGGFGTHDEGFETLTLLQTGKNNPHPLVLLDLPGENYWRRWAIFIQGQLLRRGYISPDDLSLFRIVDSAKAAVAEIETFYSNYHSSRFVGPKFVLRLHRPLPADLLEEVRLDFRDLLAKGNFEQTGPLRGEREPGLSDLTRLVFPYNKRKAGRLRQLIDVINTV